MTIARVGTDVAVALPGHAPLRVRAAHDLHVGAAIDPLRFPRSLDRVVTSVLTGPAEEERRLGRAHAAPGDEGWALHEVVRFGRRATRIARDAALEGT